MSKFENISLLYNTVRPSFARALSASYNLLDIRLLAGFTAATLVSGLAANNKRATNSFLGKWFLNTACELPFNILLFKNFDFFETQAELNPKNLVAETATCTFWQFSALNSVLRDAFDGDLPNLPSQYSLISMSIDAASTFSFFFLKSRFQSNTSLSSTENHIIHGIYAAYCTSIMTSGLKALLQGRRETNDPSSMLFSVISKGFKNCAFNSLPTTLGYYKQLLAESSIEALFRTALGSFDKASNKRTKDDSSASVSNALKFSLFLPHYIVEECCSNVRGMCDELTDNLFAEKTAHHL